MGGGERTGYRTCRSSVGGAAIAGSLRSLRGHRVLALIPTLRDRHALRAVLRRAGKLLRRGTCRMPLRTCGRVRSARGVRVPLVRRRAVMNEGYPLYGVLKTGEEESGAYLAGNDGELGRE